MICLDTNIVISMLNGRDPWLRRRLEEQLRAGTKVGMPVVALFEMRFGIAKSDRREHSERLLERFLGLGIDVLPFDAEDAAHAGDIRAHLESKGTPIGPYDTARALIMGGGKLSVQALNKFTAVSRRKQGKDWREIGEVNGSHFTR
jgi:tRNA(fMet)-specific endonuclease VapC